MMKTIFLSLFTFLLVGNTLAQNAFYDARYLMSNKKTVDVLYRNFEEYYLKIAENKAKIKESDLKIIMNVFNFVEKNPFSPEIDTIDLPSFNALATQYKNFSNPIIVRGGVGSNPTGNNAGEEPEAAESKVVKMSNLGSAAQSSSVVLGFPDPTALPSKLIDATAQFLVKRTKAELSIAFFDQFRTKIEQNKLLFHAFPSTYNMLRYQDYFTLPSLNKTWMAAFETDLHTLPYHLADYIEKEQTKTAQQPECQLFIATLRAHKHLEEGTHPAEVLHLINVSISKDSSQNIIKNAFEAIDGLSQNFIYFDTDTSKSEQKIWVSPSDYASLSAQGQNYFWGLLRLKNKALYQRLGFEALMKKNNKGVLNLGKELLDVLHDMERARYNLPKPSLLSDVKNDSTIFRKYLEYSQHLFRLLDIGFRSTYQLNNDLKGYYDSEYYRIYRPLTQNMVNLLRFTQENKWQLSMLSLLELVEALPLKKGEATNKTLQQFFYYANFMTDIAVCESTTAIENVIDRYAMPVGSYRLKRNSKWSVDLNAYPGAYLGQERLVQSNVLKSAAFGVTAPIGLSISLGQLKQNSISIFVPIVDIGAAFSYRWQNEATGFPDQLRWEHIFSPGAYLAWNIRQMPLSILVGGQYTPLLRNISDPQTAVIQAHSTLRLGMTLAVDIPIFNFFH